MARKLIQNAMGLPIYVNVPDPGFGSGTMGIGTFPNPTPPPVDYSRLGDVTGDKGPPITNTPVASTPTTSAAAAVVAPPPAFSASQMLENLLRTATGISGLGNWAADLYNRGARGTEILQALRYGTDTSDAGKAAYQSYLQAFPKMDQFLRDGVFTGESPELQYINYRNTVREAASRYGVDSALTTNDKIADYVEARVSAAEIVDRMNTAATAIASTPAETYSILEEYYGITGNDLMSFYLDTDATEAMLQKRYTAARIGTEAARQEFGINATEAEALAQRGVTIDEATQGFGTAARQSTFMQGRGETATREELIGSVFGQEEASQKIRRIAASRMGEFQEGGGFTATQQGIAGLGTSATR